MKKVLLYSIWVLWAIIIFANILRFFGNESMVAVLDSVPELSYLQQQFVKTPMFLIELGAGLLLITRCRSYKQVKEYLATKGITDKLTDYYLVMNMVYNDYQRTAQTFGLQSDVEFYFSLARDFIEDVDAKPFKIERYFECD